MNIRNRIYLLESILDDPRYEGFAPASDEDFPLDTPFPRDRNGRGWKVERFASTWKPMEVVGRVRSYNDFPEVMGTPAFSERAIDILRDLLEPNGEILPLRSSIGSYFAFNTTTIAEVLDWKKAKLKWFPGEKPHNALAIYRYEFFAERLKALSIFRIREKPVEIYVNQEFVSRVYEHNLKGFNFELVWPLPVGVDWKVLAKHNRVKHDTQGLPKGKTLKGNTAVIRLRLKDANYNNNEHKKILKILDELDETLVDQQCESPAIGNVEGHDYSEPGECRIFLSCPDADALIIKLTPWFDNLKWPAGYSVLKRYGIYVDPDAREEVAFSKDWD